MWDSHLRGRYVGFVPASSILPQFAASATHILVSIFTVNRYTYTGLLLLLQTTTVEFNFFDYSIAFFPLYRIPHWTLTTTPFVWQATAPPPARHRRYPTYRHVRSLGMGSKESHIQSHNRYTVLRPTICESMATMGFLFYNPRYDAPNFP